MSDNRLNAYLSFKDNAAEAMAFYHSVFGGELTSNTYGAFNPDMPPGTEDLIMHAMLVAPNGMTIMAADHPEFMGHYATPAGFSMSLSGTGEAELRGYWAALGEGGAVEMPLEPQMWGDTFGSVTDKFGIHWVVNIVAAPPA